VLGDACLEDAGMGGSQNSWGFESRLRQFDSVDHYLCGSEYLERNMARSTAILIMRKLLTEITEYAPCKPAKPALVS
jgi:hypothetical protein